MTLELLTGIFECVIYISVPQFSYLKNGDSNTDLTLSPPWVECSVQTEEFCQSYCKIVFGYFKLQKLWDS